MFEAVTVKAKEWLNVFAALMQVNTVFLLKLQDFPKHSGQALNITTAEFLQNLQDVQ